MKPTKPEPVTPATAMAQPDGTILDAVIGTVTFIGGVKVIPSEQGSHFTVQSFTIKHGEERIDGDAYDHPDLNLLCPVGTEVVIASQKARNGHYGGVQIRETDGASIAGLFRKRTVKRLRVTKIGVFHTPETYKIL